MLKAEAEGYHLEATKVSVFEELLKIAGASGAEAGSQVQEAAAAVGALSAKDLEEVRTMHCPPIILRRTLEATWLLLNAAKVAGKPLEPPTWQRVQKMLSDASFLTRMKSFDVEALKQAPELSSFIAAEYFGAGERTSSKRASANWAAVRGSVVSNLGNNSGLSQDSGRRRSTFIQAGRKSLNYSPRASTVVDEPLTFQRVHRASHAAGALFRWCTTTLVEVLDPQPGKLREEVLSPPAGESDCDLPSVSVAFEEFPLVCALPAVEVCALPAIATQAAATLAAAAEAAAIKSGAASEHIAPKFAPPKPPPKPKKAARVLVAATPPDRHFELFVVFSLGNAGIPSESVAALQTVASMLCVRPGLSMEIQGCPDRIEHEALARTRVSEVQKWFADNGIQTAICVEARFAKAGEDPGVVCRVLLHKDRALRDYFIIRDNPLPDDEIVFGRDVIRDAQMLEEDFATVKH